MSEDIINELRGLAYEYCNEKKTSYVGGQTISYRELNKMSFEKLSGFVNWIATEALEASKHTDALANIKPKRKLATGNNKNVEEPSPTNNLRASNRIGKHD